MDGAREDQHRIPAVVHGNGEGIPSSMSVQPGDPSRHRVTSVSGHIMDLSPGGVGVGGEGRLRASGREDVGMGQSDIAFLSCTDPISRATKRGRSKWVRVPSTSTLQWMARTPTVHRSTQQIGHPRRLLAVGTLRLEKKLEQANGKIDRAPRANETSVIRSKREEFPQAARSGGWAAIGP